MDVFEGVSNLVARLKYMRNSAYFVCSRLEKRDCLREAWFSILPNAEEVTDPGIDFRHISDLTLNQDKNGL